MIKSIVLKTGLILGAISDSSTVLPVDSTFLSIVNATMDFGAGDYFYMSLQEGSTVEEVKVIDAGDGYVVIDRAQGDTDASAFTLAAKYSTALTTAATQDIASGVVTNPGIVLEGEGQVTVVDNGGGNFSISAPTINLDGANGIEIEGLGHNEFVIGLTGGGNCCGDGEVVPTDITIAGGGLVNASVEGNDFVISVDPPQFTGVGIDIDGSWPYLEFSTTVAGGTVTSVGVGAGLSITGNPNINPTLSMSNTGVSAGTYGDVIVNSRGQFTSIALGFNPISVGAAGNGLSVVRLGHTVTYEGIDAAEGVKGVVALADADDPLDPADVTTAVTPKLLASVISELASPVAQGGQVYSGEADGDYTETIATTAIALILDATDQVIVIANVTVRDNSNPTVAQEYGLALFTASGTRLHSNKKLTQNNQMLTALITGPLTDGLVLKTTALASGAAVISQAIVAIQL